MTNLFINPGNRKSTNGTDTFDALADPTRRRILELLASKGRLSATAIAQKFDFSPPAISQHLKILREADLVKMEKKAQLRLYQVNPKKMEEIEKWVRRLTGQLEARFDRLEKVLEEEKHKRLKMFE